jgi:hypothetical protein
MRRSSLALALSAVAIASAMTLSGCSLFTPDFEHVAPSDVPKEYTEPGTELGQDEVARVFSDSPEVDVAISIREIKEYDQSLFNQFDNKEEFEDYTPIVVVVQYDTLDDFDKGGDLPSFESLGGKLGNGENAEALTSGFLSDTDSVCPYKLEDGGEGEWALTCIVYLVPEGEKLESIGFYGYDFYAPFIATIEPGNEDFEENPITWKV